jgi:hypothetical protein
MIQNILSNIDNNWPNIQVTYHKPIELYVDSLHNYQDNESFKILWVKEVEEISRFKVIAINNYKKFDFILTYDQDVLDKCENSVMFEFGTSWVFDYDYSIEKKYQVSHLVGHKFMTFGHKLRHDVYHNQNKITLRKDFYISGINSIPNIFDSKILGDKKNPLFESQYNICIENSKQKNLFTEKLIDCLYTKTIPIFYGCDNIGDFFDKRGFFIVNNLSEIIEVCNNLTEDTYFEKLEYVNKNFDISKKYIYLLDRLKDIIEKNLKYE